MNLGWLHNFFKKTFRTQNVRLIFLILQICFILKPGNNRKREENKRILISEERKYDKNENLASRDIVSRAIYKESNSGNSPVFLNCSPLRLQPPRFRLAEIILTQSVLVLLAFC